MMFDRRLVQNFDWGLLILVLLLAAFGLTTLFSAVTAGTAAPQKALFYKQMIWFGAGLGVALMLLVVSYRTLERWAPGIYVICILMLVAVLLFGKVGGGAKRWLALGPISIQPSEMVKIALVLMLARTYAKIATPRGITLRGLILPVLITALPFALIVKQPDLGTAMLLALIAGAMTLFIRIERRSLVVLVISGVLVVPAVWFLLKGYQKQRILTFLNPDRDPLGAGYHIIQSKIAIGSGMLSGKGYLKGTQNALSFLPEQHTDFIFSVLAEEMGLLGGGGLLLLFLVFMLWGLNIAHSCRDPFGTLLTVGLVAMISWQVVINIGMVMGLMPVVGVTLPFISYGGSSVLTVMAAVGLMLNVSMRRFLRE
jgi:rod shape determining protein RodA